jgi:hypothetical protein
MEPPSDTSAQPATTDAVDNSQHEIAAGITYTVQAFHSILQTAARQREFTDVAAMKAKYWRRSFGVDDLVTISPGDMVFFEKWNTEREKKAVPLKSLDWVKAYHSAYSKKERNMALHEYATLGAIISTQLSKDTGSAAVSRGSNSAAHAPTANSSAAKTPVTNAPAANSPKSSAVKNPFPNKRSVDNSPPRGSAVKLPANKTSAASSSTNVESQDKPSAANSSMNVESQDPLQASKRVKSSNAPGADLKCSGAPQYVPAVIHLLSEPLGTLLCNERYRTYLQRVQSFKAIDQTLELSPHLVVELPSIVSRLLNARLSNTGTFVVATEFVEQASWLYEKIQQQQNLLAGVQTFADSFITALLESLRRHTNDEPDLSDGHREPNLTTMYQASPVEPLIVAYYMSLATCTCGNAYQALAGSSIICLDSDALFAWPEVDFTCGACEGDFRVSVSVKQFPMYILVRVLAREPLKISVFEDMTLERTDYQCCGFIGVTQKGGLATWLPSGQEWYRYQYGDACCLEESSLETVCEIVLH